VSRAASTDVFLSPTVRVSEFANADVIIERFGVSLAEVTADEARALATALTAAADTADARRR
jgi:hypothetical protein